MSKQQEPHGLEIVQDNNGTTKVYVDNVEIKRVTSIDLHIGLDNTATAQIRIIAPRTSKAKTIFRGRAYVNMELHE